MLMAATSFAKTTTVRVSNVPAWDQPLHAQAFKFDDPYTVNYWCLVQGTWYQPPYQLQLYAELNTAATVRWDVVFEVEGKWDSLGGNYGFKTFVVSIPAGQQWKIAYFPLGTNEVPDPNWCNYVSEGPH